MEGDEELSGLPHLRLIPLTIAAAALVIGYFALSTARSYYHDYQLHKDEAQIRRDIAQLDQDHGQLTSLRDYLKSDEYIEDVARRTLGLVKPGETLVVVSGKDAAPTPSATAGADRTPAPDWWKSLFGQVEAVPTPIP